MQERILTSMAYFITTALNASIPRKEKKQSFRKKTVEDVTKTFKSLAKQQQHEEVRAIYRSSPYRFRNRYKKFEIYSVKWYSMDPEWFERVKRF